MGASQTQQQIGKGDSSDQQKQMNANRIPQININIETWTRESHGLYDFEGTEIKTVNLKLKGSHRINRTDSNVSVTELASNQTFEQAEKQIDEQERDSVIVRCLFKDNSYWIFHKNFIDESHGAVLERKPEEKIWQVVKQIKQPNFDFPCFKIQKRDLIKVGRVRFKIRDVMSPAYKDRNQQDEYQNQCFRNIYPDYEPSSVMDSISSWNEKSIQEGQRENQQSLISKKEPPAGEQVQTESDVDLVDQENVVKIANGDSGQNQADQNNIERINLSQTELFRKKSTAPFDMLKKKKTKEIIVDKVIDQEKDIDKKSEIESAVCRICLTEEEPGIMDPLISPCKCAGSMRFIHHSCLKTWFAQKRVMKTSSIVTTYFWKNLECELCKSPYPYETRSLNGREMLNIIDYQLPERSQNYLVLESISSNTSKVIHVINMTNTVKLYIGRGHDAHVRVTDISVSRLHAVLIKSVEGFYYLTDNDSKFGTLALVRTPIQLIPDQRTQLQIGRSLISVEVRDSMQNALLQCLCMNQKESNRLSTLDSNDAISLDGIDYFPKEFASQAYLQLMQNRKLKQLRSQKSKQKSPQVANRITTQNNESAMDQVDQYINFQNNFATAAILLAEDANQQQISEFSDSREEEEDERNESFDQSLQQDQVLNNYHPNGEQDQDLSPNQSVEQQSSSEEQDDENERINQQERDQLEQAIQQSLLLHQQQTQVGNQKTVRIVVDQVEQKQDEEEKVQIKAKQDEVQKKQVYDYLFAQDAISNHTKQLQLLKSQTQQNDDQASQISTSRASLNPGFELRSSHLLLKPNLTKTKVDKPNFDPSEQAIVQPDDALKHLKERESAFQLQLNEEFNQNPNRNSSTDIKRIGKFDTYPGVGSPLILPKRITIPQTSRNGANHDIAREIILEQREELQEDMHHNNQIEHETIDQQIPFSATEVQPLQQN